jgi:imidazolonepropionase-like amidohydrolase
MPFREAHAIDHPSRPQLVRAGWLIDGTGESVQQDVLLRIRKGRLISIAPATSEVPAEATLLDGRRSTILPGLVDAHVHLCLSGTEDMEARRRQLEPGRREAREMIERHLKDHLARGVVAVRDGGDREGHTLRFREEQLSSSGIPLFLRVAGPAWHAPGRYGRLIGQAPGAGRTLAEAVGRCDPRIDHVKIINSGLNSLLRFGRETSPQFSPGELGEAVRAARARGLPVMVHANGAVPVRGALTAGCDSVEHGFFMGADNLLRLVRLGTVWIPTACTMSAYARALPPGSREALGAERTLEHQVGQLRGAVRAGVRVALGTDSGSPGVHHGRAVSEEMGLLMRAGMSPAEAVRSASWYGASLLGLEDRLGRLTPGRPATFLVVRGGPDRFPESLSSPLSVYVEGVRRFPV